MDEKTTFEGVKKTISDFFQSSYVIQLTHSGGPGHQGNQPMELNQTQKGKQEGKGKSGSQHRGKGKGKSAMARSGISVRCHRLSGATYAQGHRTRPAVSQHRAVVRTLDSRAHHLRGHCSHHGHQSEN
eukprot:3447517-Amphidinium_carterae.1